ncbi:MULTISPECIES: Vms1/Ankzf1 family peptidyl-tRNA hydrolase [unclassified Agrococcus]|uniref:baeRF2 domain-containing protein n=1 Tax=unclassified Agrococcus TaxID=2615065 RepID=UPI003620A023
MRDLAELQSILEGEAPDGAGRSGWTIAYVDGPGDQPRSTEDARERALVERLAAAGAPQGDVDAVVAALAAESRVPSPSTRYVAVRDGEVVVDEHFAGARVEGEAIEHGAVPRILPLLRQRAGAVRVVVVETGREGAQVRLETAGAPEPDVVEEVVGRDDELQKVSTGGLGDAKYQHYVEEVWAATQAQVAAVVDRLVREHRPRLVVAAGDVRARQLLRERLASASAELLVEVDAHTRADGAGSEALDAAIASAVDAHRRAEVERVHDRAAARDGAAGAHGVDEVVHALQRAQVAELVLDARHAETGRCLDVLDGAPWVAGGDAEPGDATAIATVDAGEALARAAILGGATVHVVDDEPLAPDAPRDDRPPREPVALLRWSDEAGA